MRTLLTYSSRFSAVLRVAVVLGWLWPAGAVAATYYVDNAGSPGNSCFESNPATQPSQRRSTIPAGMQCMGSGDRLVIFPHSSGAWTAPNACLRLDYAPGDVSGSSWGSATRIDASQPGVIINPQDGDCAGMTVIGERYVIFDGFVLSGLHLSGTFNIGVNGISGNPGNHHIRIQNTETRDYRTPINIESDGHWEFINILSHTCWPGEGPELGCTGGYIHSGPDHYFENATFCNHGWGIQFTSPTITPLATGTMVNSTFCHNSKGGIAGSNLSVYNSLFYGNAGGIVTNGGINAINSTFYNNNVGLQLQDGGGYDMRNNILLDNSSAMVCHTGNCHAIGTFQGNLCNSTSGEENSGCSSTGSSGNTFASVSEGSGQFLHLRSGAPAIGAAVNTGIAAVTTDKTGAARSLPYDSGAYEFGTTAGGPPVALAFGPPPPSTSVGATMAPMTVRIVDAGGATVSTATHAVTVALGANPGGGTLSCGPATCTRGAVGGIATFDGLSISGAGSGKTLVATASGLAASTSAPFTISTPVPTQLAFGVQPSTTMVGATMTPPVTVTVRDAAFQIIASTIPVTLALQQNPAQGTLSGTLTRNAVAGIATFDNLSVNTAGTGYTLRATSTTPGVGGDQTDFFTITPATAVGLAFLQPPASTQAGAVITPAVSVRLVDTQGATVPQAGVLVTMLLGANPGSSTLSGTTQVATDSNGVATFGTLRLNNAGTGYTLVAQAPPLASTTSAPFNIAPPAAAVALMFLQPPASTQAGAVITPAVSVRLVNAGGTTVPQAGVLVMMLLGANPGGSTLSGTTQVLTDSNGVAMFGTLSLNNAGNNYTLVAQAEGLTSTTSAPFHIAPPATGVTYYVKPPTQGGSDTAHDCTEARTPTTPKQTIAAAITCMSSGDTVSVGPGIYEEHLGDLGSDAVIPPGTSWSAPTTIKCEGFRTCTLRIPTASGHGSIMDFQTFTGDWYLSIEGFLLSALAPGKRVGYGVGFEDPRKLRFKDLEIAYPTSQGFQGAGCGECQFLNVFIHHVAHDPATGTNICDACGAEDPKPCPGECHGYYLCKTGSNTSGLLLDGGRVDGAYGDGLQFYCGNSTIRNMTLANLVRGAHLISGGNQLYNNVFTGNKSGIQVPSANNDIVGNTVYGPPQTVVGGGLFGGIFVEAGNRVKNNLLVQVNPDNGQTAYVHVDQDNNNQIDTANALRGGDATLGGTVVGNVCDNPAAIGCTITSAAATYFVNAAGGDFHLYATSPALNQGVPLPPPFQADHDGRLRGDPPDTGAYDSVGLLVAVGLAFLQPPASTQAADVITPAVSVRLVNTQGATVATAGVLVTMLLGANPGGSTLSGTTQVLTDSNGVATFGTLRLNNAGTGYTLVAQAEDLASTTSAPFDIAPPATSFLTPPIKVDQFGYLPTATKVAVLSNPQTGFNATDVYTPGTPLTVKTSPGGTTVFTGTAAAWNGGATHAQSGDQLWWFDFSSVTTPGTYVIADETNMIQSDVFVIGGMVYNAVLTAAQRMYYYQRSGVAKAAPYTDPKWVDGAAFLGAGQDTQARSVLEQGNPATARDLRGGWFDAGDYNKYTVWGADVVSDLLTAYQQAPGLWTDTTNIPESGNGLPDLVDEVKWELDWLLRMQAATGNGSVLSKVSVLLPDATSPPSADTRPRYWGAASTAATAASAAAFAQGAIVFGALGQTAYASTLTTAAQNAWTWAAANPAVDYPNTGFGTVNPDPCGHGCPYGQLMERLRAAIYLYGLTGSATYKTFVETNYTTSHALAWGYWYYSEARIQDALLYYASLPGATAAVKNAIQTSAVGSIAGAEFVTAWTGALDGYRAYLKDVDYTWGSNRNKAATGTLYTNLIAYGLNSAQHALYRTIGASYLHALHGVNPLGMAYLSRMGGLGAERSANEMYHSWFADGTEWDHALTSPKGPPPGFLTSGPYPGYSGTQTPPLGQPLQKAYKDWNGVGVGEKSWEISEPSISYQAAYLRLLSQVMPVPTGVPTSLAFAPPPPTGAVAGVAITPPVTVRVLDAGGVIVSGSTIPVTIALAAGPTGSTLACGPATCTKNAVGGIATFDTLSVATGGTGYKLGASTTTPGVSPAQSDFFAVESGPATGPPRLAVPPNPPRRYFVNAATGTPVYVAGSHTWNVFQDRPDHAPMDYPALLAAMGTNWDSSLGGIAKHRLLRLWSSEAQMNADLRMTPDPFVNDGPGGQYNLGPAGNCTLANPDAPRFNQAYFDRLASRVAQAKAAGIYVSVMLFQPWSLWDKGFGSAWPAHWFHPTMNCNGLNGNPNSGAVAAGYRDGMGTETRAPLNGGTARTVSDQNVLWRIQVAYVKKVIDTIHSPAAGGGDNVLYEIANEGGWFSSEWQDDLITMIKAYEAQAGAGACGGYSCKAHPVGKTFVTCFELEPFPSSGSCESIPDSEAFLTASPADWIGLFQYAYYPDQDDDPRLPPSGKVHISDSDHGYIHAFSPIDMWKHFFRGHNLWYMDSMDLVTETTALAQRQTLGFTVAYADKVHLLNMVHQAKGTTTPASSGYAMSNALDGEYMALRLDSPLTFSVPAGTYACEWFDIDTHAQQSCGTVSGTPASQPFTNAVLLLRTPGPTLAAPSALRSLTQSVTTSGTITLGWDCTGGCLLATGFRVYEDAGCTGTFSLRPGMPLPPSPTTYTRSDLALGSTTCWRVTAVEGATESVPSNTHTWTVLTPPTDLTISIFSTSHFLAR